MLDRDFRHLDSLTLELSNKNVGASSIWTWILTETALVACPPRLGGIDVVSIIFATVICDADDPCSVNSACDPESSLFI